jgi:hypothetical protein
MPLIAPPPMCSAVAILLLAGPASALAQQPAPKAQQPPARPAPSATRQDPTFTGELGERLQRAGALSKDGKYAEAAEQYAWLWEHGAEQDKRFLAVRDAAVANQMEWLAMRSPESRTRFSALRDAAEARIAEAGKADPPAGPGVELVSELVALNRVVDDQDRTLAWFDKAKADPVAAPVLTRSPKSLEELLEAKGRWRDLGTYVYIHPEETVTQAVKANHEAFVAAMNGDPVVKDMLLATQERAHTARMSRIYASLLATKRDAEAAKVLEIVASDDSTGRLAMGCILKALDAGEARQAMRKALDDAWKKGAGILVARDRLNRALGK